MAIMKQIAQGEGGVCGVAPETTNHGRFLTASPFSRRLMQALLAAARAGEPGVRIPRGGRGTLTERIECNEKIFRATFQTIVNG